jgi:pSer/pThr/pTyr-binding forkhead associated (FHA) protein
MRVDEVILHFLEGENEGVEIKLTPPREIYIGRSEESDVFLGEKKISRKHCQILVSDEQVRIVDLESTNGSFVNSKKISEQTLKNGDKIKVGSSVIEVEVVTQEAQSEAPTGSKAKEKAPVKAPPKKAPEKEKPVEKEKKKDESSGTVYVKDLDDVEGSPKEKSKKKNYEEDSDLVVEYQTSIKEAKKSKDSETSEKIQAAAPKAPPKVEEPEEDEFDELDLDVESASEPASEPEMELEPESEEQISLEPESEVEEDEPVLDLEEEPDDLEASFDKLPDLEHLDENPGMDLDLDEEAPAPKSSKPMTGDLSSMGLSDLLQNLNQNKKTGILSLNTGSMSGKIYIREGALLGAESEKAVGLKTMYRMLTWKSGDFEFQPMDPDASELKISQKPIAESIESILMEGFRQYDELRKIQKVLPQMEDELELENQLEVPISKLHPKVLDVVQLIINHKKMKTVLDLSPLSDLETSKIVFYLIKKKVIRKK